ncbi:MAG: hypothetical protein WCP99_07345 [Burkholderiales bacterium]
MLATCVRIGRHRCFVLFASMLVAGHALAQIPPAPVTARCPGISVLAPAQSFFHAPDVMGGSVPERALERIGTFWRR